MSVKYLGEKLNQTRVNILHEFHVTVEKEN